MDKSYSIEEILSAVEEINVGGEKNFLKSKNISNQKTYSSIPKRTLKIIQEAEKYKED
tara:strand:+ start:267 stop:440 length:174 start_codon:yes stop_codon:yes gene_type:complete